MLKILFINNCYGWSEVISGGEKRIIQILKNYQKNEVYFEFMTTPGGVKALKRNGVLSKVLVNFTTPLKINYTNLNIAFSYLISTISSFLFLNKVKKFDLFYSISDYFCDVIPAVFFKIILKKKYAAIIHHLNESPFKRKGNKILNCISYISQKLSFKLIDKYADLILVYNNLHGKRIKKLFNKKKKIKLVNCGIDYRMLYNIKSPKKKYDLCYICGLRLSKGIYEFLNLVEIIKKKNPQILAIMIGGGSKEVENELTARIKQMKLDSNIIWKGYIKSNIEVYKNLKASKLFISNSNEEGWGISICEALACGVPAVVNNLKTYSYLKNKIYREKNTNLKKFSETINFLIKKKIKFKDFTFIKKFSWENISKQEFMILNNLINHK
jgi:glycosyltransferase involved in cell wall biosynthesis